MPAHCSSHPFQAIQNLIRAFRMLRGILPGFWFEGASLFTDEQDNKTKKKALDFLIACAIISTRPTSSSVYFYCGKYVKFRRYDFLLHLFFPFLFHSLEIGIYSRRTIARTATPNHCLCLCQCLAYAHRISFKLTPSSFNFSDFFCWTFFKFYL